MESSMQTTDRRIYVQSRYLIVVDLFKSSVTLLFIALFLAGCTTPSAVTPSEEVKMAETSYDMNSWKTEIPAACNSFYDGCNNCRRPANQAGGDIAACTRKFCAQYTKPICLDEPQVNVDKIGSEAINEPSETTYHCENKTVFTIFFADYVVDDQRMKIKPGQAMFRDHQSKTVYMLTQQPTGSGMLYSNKTFEFRGKGDEAMIRRSGQALAIPCKVLIAQR
jgi:membrane-bound inhibitor of C-type lysozyme